MRTASSCKVIRLPERATNLLECRAKSAQHFFFAVNNGKAELKRKRLAKLLNVLAGEVEVNSIVTYRIARIVDSLIEANHADMLRAFVELKLDVLLLQHFYDYSIGQSIYFNVLVNVKGSGGDVSLMNESPRKSRSPSMEVHNCCERPDCEHRQSESFTITMQERRSSPSKKSLKEIGLSLSYEKESKEVNSREPKRYNTSSLNVSNNYDQEREKEKAFYAVWDFRLAVLRRLMDMIATSQNDESAANGLIVLVKFAKEIQSILDFKQMLVELFYRDVYLMKIYARAKMTPSDSTFYRAIEVLIVFLELHKELFSAKACEDRGIKLGTKFCGTYIDIIEELKDHLNTVGS